MSCFPFAFAWSTFPNDFCLRLVGAVRCFAIAAKALLIAPLIASISACCLASCSMPSHIAVSMLFTQSFLVCLQSFSFLQNFHFAHASADPVQFAYHTIRSAFEYQASLNTPSGRGFDSQIARLVFLVERIDSLETPTEIVFRTRALCSRFHLGKCH